MTSHRYAALAVFFLFTLGVALACAPDAPPTAPIQPAAPPPEDARVRIQILAINDFHGYLEPPVGSSGEIDVPLGDGGTLLVPAGGAVYLATHIQRLRRENPNTVVVSAGDLTGASPLVSNLFRDEPAVLVMNQMHLDFEGVGNHDFDRGLAELFRLQRGGSPRDPDAGARVGTFPGASFKYLAANVRNEKGTVFPPYAIRELAGARVAFIGLTLEGTPRVTALKAVAGLTFANEAATVNALVPELEKQGTMAIVLLLHQGGFQGHSGNIDSCEELSGDLLPILEGDADAGRPGLSPAVDVVLSAHTHQAYDCLIGGRIVTSAASYGRVITKIDLVIDKASGRVVEKRAKNLPVTRDVAPDPEVAELVEEYRARAAPVMRRVVGYVKADFTANARFAGSASCETPLGDLIADSQLAATSDPSHGSAVIAFMNAGGIRADLVAKGPGKPDFAVTYAEAFDVQPFGNDLCTLTLTGAQIRTLLEEQFVRERPRVLQVSEGFSYAYTHDRAGRKATIHPGSMRLRGAPIEPNKTYRVAANAFLAAGGDDFTVLAEGTDRVCGPRDSEAFTAYLGRASSASAPLLPAKVPLRIQGDGCL